MKSHKGLICAYLPYLHQTWCASIKITQQLSHPNFQI
jgi:hypothetical protein